MIGPQLPTWKARRLHPAQWAPIANPYQALWLALLLLASAGLVAWQGLRLGVLWDLSYVLDNAWRIALGQVPYRDFPFPFPPLTFLIQALVIELFGRVYWHHLVYCALAGGAASLLSLGILRRLLQATGHPEWTAALLSAPLIVLGVYAIFPHPFYDPDCTIAILAGLALLLRWEAGDATASGGFAVGLVLALPLFVKQNIGGAFLVAIDLALGVLALGQAAGASGARRYAWVIAGSVAGVGLGLALLQAWAGLASYYKWTVAFAASRRLPGLGDLWDIYREAPLPWWLLAAAYGLGIRLAHRSQPLAGLVAAAALLTPFLWLLMTLLGADPDAEQGEWLLALWPFTILASLAVTLLEPRQPNGLARLLPLVLVVTIQGAFLSQQLWGSTYGIWPLLVMLLASCLSAVARSLGDRWPWLPIGTAAIIALSLLAGGAGYVASAERLAYAHPLEGPPTQSRLPALAGLRVHGPWLSDLDGLMAYAARHIPPQDGVLLLPGEVPFYYASGRTPRFPVVALDHTVNPYDPATLQALTDARGISWLIVKRRLQLDEPPMPEQRAVLALLRRSFRPVARLACCDIYHRVKCPVSGPIHPERNLPTVPFPLPRGKSLGRWARSRAMRLANSRCSLLPTSSISSAMRSQSSNSNWPARINRACSLAQATTSCS